MNEPTVPSEPAAPSTNRIGIAHGAAILVAALAVRVVYLVESAPLPFREAPVGDARGYLQWAERIAAGNWIGTEPFYQAPLYPYWLATLKTLGLGDINAILMAQCAGGAIGCLLLAMASARLFDRRVGIVAGWMWALYAPAIYFDAIIQKTSIAGLLTVAVLFLLVRPAASQGARRGILCACAGVVMAMLVLTRENALAWIPVAVVWLGLMPGDAMRRRIVGVAGFLAGTLLVLLPVGLRNVYVGGQFSLSTFQSGPNFYIGNHDGATGRYVPLVRGHETPEFERTDATRLAEEAMGRDLTSREVSSYWWRRAWSDIRESPGSWLALTGRKLLMTVNRYEVADVESYVVGKAHAVSLTLLGSAWHFGVLFPLAFGGLALQEFARRREGVPRLRDTWLSPVMAGVMIAAVAAFYIMARYRFPIAPLLVPPAALALVSLLDAWRDSRLRRGLGVMLAALVVGAVVANVPVHDESRLDALAHMNVGVAYAHAGNMAAAEHMFREAVERFPGSAEANANLAQALAMRGAFAESVPYYVDAMKQAPDLPGLEFNLAVALEGSGKWREALEWYRAARRRDPSDEAAAAAVRRLEARLAE